MDHERIQAEQVPDRYLMQKLSAEERVRFEEHFLDCPICVDDLESLEGLSAGLSELSLTRIPAVREARPPLVGRVRAPRGVTLLVAACLAVAILPPVLFFGAFRRTRGELESARKDLSAAQREKVALTLALARERAPGASAPGGAAPLAASVFTLDLTRGAGTEAPANRINLRDPREWVILLLDRPASERFESFRARLSTSDLNPVGDPLAASAASGDMLAVGIPPGLLHAGDYVLTLEGVGAGPARGLATYRFRAAPRK